jgi:hypothetical protein
LRKRNRDRQDKGQDRQKSPPLAFRLARSHFAPSS